MQNPFADLIPNSAPQPPPIVAGTPDPLRAASERRAEEAAARAERAEARASIPSGYRATESGGLEPIPGGPADPNTPTTRSTRQLPQPAIDRLTDGTTTLSALDRAVNGFRAEFSGNTFTGGIENQLQGLNSNIGTPGQNQWWQDVYGTDNVARNQLFGASLTQGEKDAWERYTVNPRMDPSQVLENLTRRAEIARGALRRLSRTYEANGYNRDAIEESMGDLRGLLSPRAEQAGANQESDVAPAAAAGAQGVGANDPSNDLMRRLQAAPRGSTERLNALEEYHRFRTEHPGLVRVALNEENGQPGEPIDALGATEERGQALLDEYQAAIPIIEAMRAREQFGRDHPIFSHIDSGVRAVANTITLGGADRLSGALSGDGTQAEHAVTEQAWRDNTAASVLGTLAGGLVLPVGATVPRQIGLGALYGGAYNFNAADGSVADRLDDAVVGTLAGGSVAGLVGLGLRGFRPSANSRTQALIEAGDRQQVPLMPADVGGPLVRRATGSMGQSTFGGAPIINAAENTQRAFANRVGQIAADEGSPVARNMLGENVQGILDRFNRGSAAEGGAIYRNAEGMAAGQSFQGNRAITRLDEHIAELSENASTNAPHIEALQTLRSDLASGNVAREKSISAMRDLRSGVRAQAQADGLRGTDFQRRAGEVLDELSADIASQLDSGAAAEFRRADQLWANRLEFIDDVESRILGPKGDRSAEQVTRRLLELSRSDSARFRRVLEQVEPQEAAIIRGTIIQEMGRPPSGTPGDFSIETWARNFRELQNNTRSVDTLFRGGNRQHANDLLTIAEAVEGAGRYRNFSNSGGAINLLNIIRTLVTGGGAMTGGIPGAIAAGGAMIGVENGLGRVLASPRFARWLARPPQRPGRALRALRRVAVAEPAIAGDIERLIRAVQQTGQNVESAVPRAAADEREDGR